MRGNVQRWPNFPASVTAQAQTKRSALQGVTQEWCLPSHCWVVRFLKQGQSWYCDYRIIPPLPIYWPTANIKRFISSPRIWQRTKDKSNNRRWVMPSKVCRKIRHQTLFDKCREASTDTATVLTGLFNTERKTSVKTGAYLCFF